MAALVRAPLRRSCADNPLAPVAKRIRIAKASECGFSQHLGRKPRSAQIALQRAFVGATFLVATRGPQIFVNQSLPS